MTISFVGAASAQATSVTLPTHQAGDLLILWAWRYGSFISPTIPAGWAVALIGTGSATADRTLLTCYKIAASSSETSGTWTNATVVTCAVYRDDLNYLAVGGASRGGNNTTSVSWSTVAAYDGQNTREKAVYPASWYVMFAAANLNSSTMEQTPANRTTRFNWVGATDYETVIHDTAATSNGMASRAVTADVTVVTSTSALEIYDTGVAKSSGGGFRAVNIRGGADQ